MNPDAWKLTGEDVNHAKSDQIGPLLDPILLATVQSALHQPVPMTAHRRVVAHR
jgi:hypothetical protein